MSKTDISRYSNNEEPEDGQPCSICHRPIRIDEHPIAGQIVFPNDNYSEGVTIFAHLYCTFKESEIEIDSIEVRGKEDQIIDVVNPYPFGYPEPNFYKGF